MVKEEGKSQMASLINLLVRKTTPSLRIIATAATKASPLFNPAPNSFLEESRFTDSSTVKPLQSNYYYPSFPFGYCLNPISITGSDQSKAIGDDVAQNDAYDDNGTVWADSVKKKRKKKMNKHKYKKLRKRLRRKT